MARKRRQAVRSTTLSSTLKHLVEAIAAKAVDRVRREMPERDTLRRIERQLARLSRQRRQRRGKQGETRVGRPRSNRRCKLRGCGLPHVAHGYCSKHYQAWRRKHLRAGG